MVKMVTAKNVLGMVLFITLSLSIKEVVCTENNTMFFPDDNGNPVKVAVKCHPKAETAQIDLPKQVRFHLFRRLDNNTEMSVQMKIGEPLPKIFIKNGTTKIIIHGFINTIKSAMIQDIKRAYLNTTNSPHLNVIGVDWGDLATLTTCYIGAKFNTLLVGPYVSKFIEYLSLQGDVDLDKLHLIGHSLGAHTAGIAGAAVKTGKVARITGLDPAGVLYGSDHISTKLDQSDAKFVDVIHTDARVLGYKDPCGHADFYPHGGGHQPNCWTITCSHSRAHIYFKESINNETQYPAIECDSLENVMGCSDESVLTDEGCLGCDANSHTFMGILASHQKDGLYFAYVGVETHAWKLPVVVGATALCGAGLVGGLTWWWRRRSARVTYVDL